MSSHNNETYTSIISQWYVWLLLIVCYNFIEVGYICIGV